MIKSIGICLVLAVSGYASLFISHYAKLRQSETHGLCLLLESLQDGVSSFSRPASEIYLTFGNTALLKIGFLPVLREKGLSAASKVLKNASHVSSAVITAFSEFASVFGTSCAEEEIRRIRLCLSALYGEEKRIHEELPKSTRIFRSLTLSAGLLIALIFW